MIHPTAIIEKGAKIGLGVTIGPYSIIGKNVVIGKNTTIGPHCVIEGWTSIGDGNQIGVSVVIGAPPQDIKYKNFKSFVEIGDNNIIREFVTVHRAADEAGKTIIGSNNMLMAYVHVAHNCRIGNENIIANLVGISGHVEIEDQVTIGGMAGIHQFTKIGKMSMIGGYSKVIKDVPPYAIVDGQPIKLYGTNYRGLRRRGLDEGLRTDIKLAFKYIMDPKLNITQAIENIKRDIKQGKEIQHLIKFLKNPSRLGIVGK